MASSGSITTGQKEGRSVTLSWTLSSQNIANNTSTIAWTLKGSGSASGWVMSGGFKAVINGTTVYSSSTDNRIQLKNGTVVASGSLTIAHNSDGTKSFNLSCEAGVYTYAVSVSASGTHTLNTIPRASSVTATSVNMGSATTITISRASSSFTHTLTYAFGNSTGTITTKTTSTSVSWTPALTLANQIAFVAIDYVTGVMCAISNHTLSSEVGFKGICRKVLIFLLVGIGSILDAHVIGSGSVLRTAVIFFYISNEGVSILENAARLGLPVPEKIKVVLEQLHDRSAKDGE